MVTAEEMEVIYESGIEITMMIMFAIALVILLYRLIQLFVEFSRGNDLDDFEDSVIIEWEHYRMGNHPGGIILDGLLHCAVVLVAGLAWPLFWVVAPFTAIAFVLRKRNVEAQKIIDRLS